MTQPSQPPPETVRDLVALCNRGRFAQAEAKARKLTRRHPDAAVLHEILAAAYAGQRKLEEAVASCREVLRLRPGHAVAHSNMGMALSDLGHFEAAAASCRAALRLRPGYADAHNNLGNALQGLGRLEEAVASYREALRLDPACAAAWGNLGVALRALGRSGEAADCYRKALRLRPGNAAIHNDLGIALKEQGRLADAVASYREALRLQPAYPEAHNNLANALHDLGRADEALASYRAVLALKPDHAMARHMVAALTGETTATAPRDYTVRLFDDYAPTFDRHLTETLGYDAPARLAALLRAAFPDRRFARALDIGCGTGLSGTAFRELADHLAGIDLSPEMVKRARGKAVYDALFVGDAIEMLAGTAAEPPFDLFIATDVLIYVGALDPLLEALSRRAAPGAVLCLTTETLEGDGYRLMPSGRYAHAEAHVRDRAAAHGFAARARADVAIRQGKDGPIAGQLFVLERGAAAG